MSTEVIDSIAGLRQIEPEWNVLLEGTANVTPFQLPLWLTTWWKHLGSGHLQALLIRDAGVLSGVVPYFRHEWKDRQQITLLGSGISDFLDPAISAATISALDEYLQQDKSWEVLDWQDLCADTPLRTLTGVIALEDTPCSMSPLTGSFEDFWNTRSKDLRRNLRRYSERAKDIGTVDFAVCEHADAGLVDELIQLHAARWQQQGTPGMISANRSEAFLREVADRFAAAGLLRFFVIRFQNRVAAILLAIVYRNQIWSYLSAFDPQHEGLGFGRLLLYESFRYAFQNGYDSWQFLRGDEPYKRSWGAQPVPKIRLYMAR